MSGQLLAVFLSTAQPWRVEVTGYCPCAVCCGRWADGMTASGARAEGKFVAAPKEIPFGTLIYIPRYCDQAVPVLDRGGAIKGNKLDLFFPTHTQAAQWGKRTMTVWVSPGARLPVETPSALADRVPRRSEPIFRSGANVRSQLPLLARRPRVPRPCLLYTSPSPRDS